MKTERESSRRIYSDDTIEKMKPRTEEKIAAHIEATMTPCQMAALISRYIMYERARGHSRKDDRITITEEEFRKHFRFRKPQTGKYSKK